MGKSEKEKENIRWKEKGNEKVRLKVSECNIERKRKMVFEKEEERKY